MKWKKYLPDLLFVLLSLAVGGLSAFAVMKGMPAYLQLRKPPLTPPPIVFPLVWGALYLLMGLGAGRVWRAGPPRRAAVAAYAVQLVWNALWMVWFFALQAHLFAFWWLAALLGLIALMLGLFARADRPAAWMQLPYLLGTVFAAYLDLGVWLLNR